MEQEHQLEEFRGKYVLVNFWAMSCNVCKSEMTTLQSAYELLGKRQNCYRSLSMLVKILTVWMRYWKLIKLLIPYYLILI